MITLVHYFKDSATRLIVSDTFESRDVSRRVENYCNEDIVWLRECDKDGEAFVEMEASLRPSIKASSDMTDTQPA